MWLKQVIALNICGLAPLWCFAIENIEVSGLLGTKASLIVDGKQQVVAVGQRTKEGVELVAIESDGVKLKIDGETRYYPLGSSQVSSKYSKRSQVQERIYKNGDMFRTIGSINGVPVNLLVATGATSVAMNANGAKRVGINHLLEGQPMRVQTAQGVTNAWGVKLKSVIVGQIELNNIDAVVLEGAYPVEVLLGMSFLGQLNIQHQGEVMVLENKF